MPDASIHATNYKESPDIGQVKKPSEAQAIGQHAGKADGCSRHQNPDDDRVWHGLNHELTWPRHDYFLDKANKADNAACLIISGPSRMGNHLILSLLDGHPDLPMVPGEDGFLSFAFAVAANDPGAFLRDLKQPNAAGWLEKFSANGVFNKWYEVYCQSSNGHDGHAPSGVGTTTIPALFDYRKTRFSINYPAYHQSIIAALEGGRFRKAFSEGLLAYMQALQKLGPRTHTEPSRFSGLICHSGMRAQSLWVLSHFPKAMLIACLRPFETYAVSHCRSRYGKDAQIETYIDEAWAHWRHKIEDYLTLKSRFPDRVALVSYRDLVLETKSTMSALAGFLGVQDHDCLAKATVLGMPAGGNASDDRGAKSNTFGIYGEGDCVPKTLVPETSKDIWGSVEKLAIRPLGKNLRS